jgi:delta 1-pyrroline-5-carboxylate dehydrogenase
MSSIDGTTPVSWEEELQARYHSVLVEPLELSEAELLDVLKKRMADLRDVDPKAAVFQILYDRVGKNKAAIDAVIEHRKQLLAAAEEKEKTPKKTAAPAKKKTKPRRKSVVNPSEESVSSVLEPTTQK